MLRVLVAILLDAFYEALDRRSLMVLSMLGLAFVVLAASVSFETQPTDEALRNSVDADHTIQVLPGVQRRYVGMLVAHEIEALGGDRYRLQIEIKEQHAHDALQWLENADRQRRGEALREGPALHVGVLSAAAGERILRGLLMRRGLEVHSVTPADGEGRRAVELTVSHPFELVDANRVSLLFGLWKLPLPPGTGSLANVMLLLFDMAANLIAGFIGIGFALLFTGSILPSALQTGTIDLMLAKPVPRVVFLAGKILAAHLYVLVSSLVIIGGTWLVLSLRTGYVNVGFLGTIVSLLACFTLVYSISTFWAVLTRSTITAVVMALLAWGFFVTVGFCKALVDELDRRPNVEVPSYVSSVVDGAYMVFPSTGDFSYLNQLCIAQGPLSEGLRESMYRSAGIDDEVRASLPWSMVKCLALAVFNYLIAALVFIRREY